MLEKIIYNEIRFENNKVYIIKFLKMIKINDIEEIKRALKSKSSSLIINFNNNLKVDYLEIGMKSTQKLETKSLLLSLSLSLLLFKKCSKIYKISKI